jgi:hypothetical protein
MQNDIHDEAITVYLFNFFTNFNQLTFYIQNLLKQLKSHITSITLQYV